MNGAILGIMDATMLGCLAFVAVSSFAIGVLFAMIVNTQNERADRAFLRRKSRALAEHLWRLWGERDEAAENIDRLVGMATRFDSERQRYKSERQRYKSVVYGIESQLSRLDDLRAIQTNESATAVGGSE